MIRYSEPFIDNKEMSAVARAVSKGHIHGEGQIGKSVEKKLADIIGAPKVFLTTSGTHALELAMMALKIGKADEVICPSFTFVSTANAIIRQGATPVFAEIERDTLNIDIDDVLRRITKRTKAIVPVHYGGFSCDMKRLKREARRRGIYVIEDAAQSIGSTYEGRHLGTFGDLGCLSFHSTKNITCGEGGAIIVNRGGLDGPVQIGREKGTNRFLFLEGKISKYSWIDIGSSFVVSDVLASMLLTQLGKLSEITSKRRKIFDMYRCGLSDEYRKGSISLPNPGSKSFGNGHIFWMVLDRSIDRRSFMDALHKRRIEVTHHYVPLHSSPFGVRYLKYRKKDLPVTEDIAQHLVRLPLYPHLKESEVAYVLENIKKLLRSTRR